MLYIHIGFHKTGSSTIQHFLAANAELLESHGVIYPRAGRHTTAHFNLTAQLMEKVTFSDAKGDWNQLIAEMEASPDADFIISSEAFHTLRQPQVEKVRDLLGDTEVVICVYIRDLGDSLVSRYGQKAKSGSYVGSFDDFFEEVQLARSGDDDEYGGTYNQIARWAAVFGWGAMRVRALDPRDLAGGDLVTDMLDAINLNRPEIIEAVSQETVSAKNAAPGWKTLELIREVHRASGGLRSERSLRRQDQFKGIRKAASRIRRSGEAVADELGLGGGRAQYLTREQWRACRAQYVADLTRLNAEMEHQIPAPSSTEPDERPFLPQASEVPAEERARFNERMLFELIPYIVLGTRNADDDGDAPVVAQEEKRARPAKEAKDEKRARPAKEAKDDAATAERKAAKQALRAGKRKEREERQGSNSKRQFKGPKDEQ